MLYYAPTIIRNTSQPVPLLDYKHSELWEPFSQEIMLQNPNRKFFFDNRTDEERKNDFKKLKVQVQVAEFTA